VSQCHSYLLNVFTILPSLTQLVLVSGHLIKFHIGASGAYYSRSSTISLLDAYVCSGHYATQSLPIGEYSTTQPPLPRRFQDGLEIEDNELDTVFLIWYIRGISLGLFCLISS